MNAIYKAGFLMALGLSTLMTSGCGSSANLGELEGRLKEIEARPRGRIEPPPEFKPIATFAYSAHQLRSPFSPPKDQKLVTPLDGRKVEPDLSRPKEYLERFALDALKMVGTISKPNEPLQALIEDPSGAVTRVKPGSHLGKNFGQVTSVSDAKIGLTEIVPDGRDGWVERTSSLTISE